MNSWSHQFYRLYLCHRDQLGRTPLHLVIAGWPSIAPTTKSSSKFHTAVMGKRRQAEACLRLLCEHGINVKSKVKPF